MKYIPIEHLQDGYLYEIDARNADFGIWIEEDNAFMISRVKFGHNFLFEEYHWDTGPPYGTVKPYREICKVPFRNIKELEWIIPDHPDDPDGKKKTRKRKKILRYLNIFEDREWKRKEYLRENYDNC